MACITGKELVFELSHCKRFWYNNTTERQKARITEEMTRMTYETRGDMATGR